MEIETLVSTACTTQTATALSNHLIDLPANTSTAADNTHSRIRTARPTHAPQPQMLCHSVRSSVRRLAVHVSAMRVSAVVHVVTVRGVCVGRAVPWCVLGISTVRGWFRPYLCDVLVSFLYTHAPTHIVCCRPKNSLINY